MKFVKIKNKTNFFPMHFQFKKQFSQKSCQSYKLYFQNCANRASLNIVGVFPGDVAGDLT
jgi:hypothetical protein